MKLYRSLFFVPGNRPEWMDKAPKYGADALLIDLEDSVPLTEKAVARKHVRAGVERLCERGVPVMVRVNGIDTGLTAEDIEAIVAPGLVAIVVPKLEFAEQVRKIDAWIELFEQKAYMPKNSVEIIEIPETARGIMNAFELATACPRVGAITGVIGSRSGDITKAIGYQWTPSELESLYVSSHILLAARAAGMQYPLTSASLEVKNLDVVRSQLKWARQLGYRGCMVIHPSAVPIANEIFSPSMEEIEWNKGVLKAMAEAEAEGRAAVTYDGMMIDYAHVRNALELIHQAEAFGLDVGKYPAIKAI